MPVTISLAQHGSTPPSNANIPNPRLDCPWPDNFEDRVPTPVSNANDLFHKSCRKQTNLSKLKSSSYTSGFLGQTPKTVHSAPHGLFAAVIKAYHEHLHLIIRPDDVWISILLQLNVYISANAKKSRYSSVSQDSKQPLGLILEVREGTLGKEVISFKIASGMGEAMEKHLLDEEFRDWLLPDFTTTRDSDKIAAGISFLGAMDACLSCSVEATGSATGRGLPSASLLGVRQDWVKLLEMLPKMEALGPEPVKFVELLTPVLKRFILSFDEPHSEAVKHFWNSIVRHHGMLGGTNTYTGWMTVFSFWNQVGESIYHRHLPSTESAEKRANKAKMAQRSMAAGRVSIRSSPKKRLIAEYDEMNDYCDGRLGPGRLSLDGVFYHHITSAGVTYGWVKVDVEVEADDSIHRPSSYPATMVAGSVGMEFGRNVNSEGQGFDVVKPMVGFWTYSKEPEEKV